MGFNNVYIFDPSCRDAVEFTDDIANPHYALSQEDPYKQTEALQHLKAADKLGIKHTDIVKFAKLVRGRWERYKKECVLRREKGEPLREFHEYLDANKTIGENISTIGENISSFMSRMVSSFFNKVSHHKGGRNKNKTKRKFKRGKTIRKVKSKSKRKSKCKSK